MNKRGIDELSTANVHAQAPEARASGPVPVLTISAHPDARRVGARLVLDGLVRGKEIALSRNGPDFVQPGHALGAPLGDPFISRKPIRLVAAGSHGVRIIASDGGTEVSVDPLGEPVRRAVELGPEDLARGVPMDLAGRVLLLLHMSDRAERDAVDRPDALGMVGNSAGICRVRRAIERIADLEVPVLIRGETGTGKELVARAIHDHGPRRKGPFVSVNLGAIPRELAAAELFGARKGAYTGATHDRPGFFAAARGGTLFLDEVGEASTEIQAMLLRVLETGELYPVGGQSAVATDARVIAATDADIEQHIRDGLFKEPLFHRLAGYQIRVPPLRERREDTGTLFYYFAREQLDILGEGHRLTPEDPYASAWLPAPLAARLIRYDWPGNVRQLRNVARQMVIENRGKEQVELDAQLAAQLDAHAGAEVGGRAEAAVPRPVATAETAETAKTARTAKTTRARGQRKPSEVSEDELRVALREHAWDLKAASDALGVSRPSMYDLIQRSPSIRTAGDLSADEIRRCHEACAGDLDAMAQRLEVSRRALKRRVKELGLASKSSDQTA